MKVDNFLRGVCTVIFVVTLFPDLSFGQEKYFQRIYEGGQSLNKIDDVKVSKSSGSVYLKVFNQVGGGGNDRGFMKLDSNLTPVWVKMIETSTREIGQRHIFVDEEDFIYGTIGVERGIGNDTWFLKLDAEGEVVWSELLLVDEDEADLVWAGSFGIDELSSGELVAVGSGSLTGYQANPIIFKLDKEGGISSSIYFEGNNNNIWDFVATQDGGVLLLGNEQDSSSWNQGLIKLSKDFEIEWSKSYGGNQNERDEDRSSSRGAVLELDSFYIFSGVTNSFGSGGLDVTLTCVDKTGEVVWSKVIGSENRDLTAGQRMHYSNGRIYLMAYQDLGLSLTNSRLVVFDRRGNEIEQLKYWENDPMSLRSIEPTKNGLLISAYQEGGIEGSLDLIYINTDDNGKGVCNEIASPIFEVLDITEELQVSDFDKAKTVQEVIMALGATNLELVDYPFEKDSIICPELEIIAPDRTCAGQEVILNTNFGFGAKWSSDPAGAKEINDTIHMSSTASTFYVTDASGRKDSVTITISPSGECLGITSLGKSVLCEGDSLEVASSGFGSVSWYSGDGSDQPISVDESFYWRIADSPQLILKDEWGNSDTLIITFDEIYNCSDPLVYQLISPNDDGKNDAFTVLGLEKFKSNEVWIFNIWGNHVFHEVNYTNSSWSPKELPDGDYLYHVKLDDLPLEVGKLTIRR